MNYLRDLPHIIEFTGVFSEDSNKKVVVVHAGVNPRLFRLEDNTAFDCMHQRNLYASDSESGLEATEKTNAGSPWVNFYGIDQDTIVFGHDATRKLQNPMPNIWGLDTGCVYGDDLTGLVLPALDLVQVRARCAYKSKDPLCLIA